MLRFRGTVLGSPYFRKPPTSIKVELEAFGFSEGSLASIGCLFFVFC